MASGKHSWLNPVRAAALLLACLLVFAGSVQAEPGYKALKAEITKLEQAETDARRERRDADAKLAENRAAQQKAEGAALAALKRAAINLAQTAGEKADAFATAQQNLAAKRAELRESAAAHAVKQLTEAGAIDKRVGEAANALDDWKTALGTLPEVPSLRPLDGIDPDDQPAVRKQDKKTLEAFEKWAAGEASRIDKEIKQAKELVDGESKWKVAEDGGEELVSSAKALREKLEGRKKDLEKLRESAKVLLKQIK